MLDSWWSMSWRGAGVRLVSETVSRFGRLDALCNVAGILRMDHTHELALEDWTRVLTVNLTGTFLMCQAALPHLSWIWNRSRRPHAPWAEVLLW